MNVKGDIVMFKTFLNKSDEGVLSSSSNIDLIRQELREQFEKNETIVLDFEGVRAISPSFAYECFGQIYSEKKRLELILSKIHVVNDNLNLYEKIKKAVQRRIIVLS